MASSSQIVLVPVVLVVLSIAAMYTSYLQMDALSKGNGGGYFRIYAVNAVIALIGVGLFVLILGPEEVKKMFGKETDHRITERSPTQPT